MKGDAGEILMGKSCLSLMKKHLVTAFLLFSFLTFLETGIIIEVLGHGWGGFGDISLEYTRTGEIRIGFLIFFIPISTVAISLIRIIGYKKRTGCFRSGEPENGNCFERAWQNRKEAFG